VARSREHPIKLALVELKLVIHNEIGVKAATEETSLREASCTRLFISEGQDIMFSKREVGKPREIFAGDGASPLS